MHIAEASGQPALVTAGGLTSPQTKELEVPEKVTRRDAQCFRNSQKRMEADPLLAALDLAYIDRMQLSLFRQLFLAHPGLVAVLPDRRTEDFELLSGVRHSPPKEQEDGKWNTPNMGVFLRLRHWQHTETLAAMDAGRLQTCRV